MGCFNVVCSISNLSIHHGTKVAFIPLLRSDYSKFSFSKQGMHEIKAKTQLIHQNEYFTPLTLPIFGEYNDYGSLEEIEKNDHTDMIERFFGSSIEEFMNFLGERRNIMEFHSDFSRKYAVHGELVSSSEFEFDEFFLVTLGFHKEEKGYQFKKMAYFVEITEGEQIGFTIKDEKENILYQSKRRELKEEFVEVFEKLTSYLLLVSPEHQQPVKILRQLSGMFVHKDIYDECVAYNLKETTAMEDYVENNYLTMLGFDCTNETEEIFYFEKGQYPFYVVKQKEQSGVDIISKENDERYEYLYNVKRFVEKWETLTKEKLDTTEVEKIYIYDEGYEDFKGWLNGEHDREDYEIKYYIKEYNNAETEEGKESFKKIIDMTREQRKSRYEKHGYGRRFKDWKLFDKMYSEEVKKGKFKDEFREYIAFENTAYSCNRFFFPGMNGEQHGNLDASKMLLEKSLEIVNEKLSEYQ